MSQPVVSLDLESLERSMGPLTEGKPTDQHRAEAAKMFMVPENQVTEKQRLFAKQQAFLRVYSAPRRQV